MLTDPAFAQISPIELHVPSFEIVKCFYGSLGFEVVWERPPEADKGYLVIRRDKNILCFWPGNASVEHQSYFSRFPAETKRGYGVEIVIQVDNLDATYQTAMALDCIVEDLEL